MVILSCGFPFQSDDLVHAQIVTDATYGLPQVLTGPNYLIQSELGKTVGGNLFHSFQEFNLSETESASFIGDKTIKNIISRVTGGNKSVLNGLVRSEIDGANFYFINPMGIIFGPSAHLDVSGAIIFSTADIIELSDGGYFSAVNSQSDLLTIGSPETFGFLSLQPTPLIVSGSFLQTAIGETLSLIAGNIELSGGNITVEAGMLNLVSVGSSGNINLAAVDNIHKISWSDFLRWGAIAVYDGQNINLDGASGSGLSLKAGTLTINDSVIHAISTVEGGKSINIQVQDKIELSDGAEISTVSQGSYRSGDVGIIASELIVRNGSIILSLSEGPASGGHISVKAQQIYLEDLGALARTGIVADTVSNFNSGIAGNINLISSELIIHGEALISSSTFGDGDCGRIDVIADTIMINGYNSEFSPGIYSQVSKSDNSGIGGVITIEASQLILTRGGVISSVSSGIGRSGDIEITTQQITISGKNTDFATGIFSFTEAEDNGGSGGNIIISASIVKLSDGAVISADTFGTGNAGTILIDAGKIHLSGHQTGLFSDSALISGGGDGGNIIINAGDLNLEDGARLTTITYGTGVGGNILIHTESLELMGLHTTISSETVGEITPGGDGGDIKVNTKMLEVKLGASINAGTSGSGAGGMISIDAENGIIAGIPGGSRSGVMSESSSIRFHGKGGDINIYGNRLDVISNGLISVASMNRGNAGKISIAMQASLTLNQGAIASSALDGNGGDITINAVQQLMIVNSKVSSAAGGNGGVISLQSGDIFSVVNSNVIAYAINDGGNIHIDSFDVILDRSLLNASAINGAGGNITITSHYFWPTPDSIIDASSQFGLAGEIDVFTAEIDFGSIFVDLPTDYETDPGMQERCAVRFDDKVSYIRIQERVDVHSEHNHFCPVYEQIYIDDRARKNP